MKMNRVRICITLVVGVLSLALIGGCDNKSTGQPASVEQEIAQIRAAFESYHAAVAAKDSASAVALLSQDTKDYYQQAARLALYGKVEELNAAPVPLRMLAITLRLRLDPAEAHDWSGEQVLARCVERGWMAAEDPSTVELQTIVFDGKRATSQYVVTDFPPLPQEFTKEAGQWKNHEIPKYEKAISSIFDGITDLKEQNDRILMGISFQKDITVPATVWEPPLTH